MGMGLLFIVEYDEAVGVEAWRTVFVVVMD
jgi:hypothetical protein